MSEHPDARTLERFLRNETAATDAAAVLSHLLQGCLECRDRVRPQLHVLLRLRGAPPETAAPAQSADDLDAAYEVAISAACAKAIAWRRKLLGERDEAPGKLLELLYSAKKCDAPELCDEAGFWTWGLCEVLLEKSWALRHDDPQGMLHLASLARAGAERLDEACYGRELVADLKARAWAELANAYRVGDDLVTAEAAMARALDLRRAGTGNRLLLAAISELVASLYSHQRRFREAFRALDIGFALYRRFGDAHDAGRMLIRKGLHTGYTGDPEGAIQLLARALSMIDHDRDARLVFQTLHNILLFRVDLGQFREARLLLWQMRPLYVPHSGKLDLIKLRGIEGRIAAGLGDLGRAEAAFQQASAGFDEQGLGYHAALASLDLAAVWLRQGRTAEVRGLVAKLVATFRGLGVAREAMAAILMLRDAVERDQAASLQVLELVSGLLQRLDQPTLEQDGLERG